MKNTYKTPEAELLVIRFEEGILNNSNKANAAAMNQNDDLFDDWDF